MLGFQVSMYQIPGVWVQSSLGGQAYLRIWAWVSQDPDVGDQDVSTLEYLIVSGSEVGAPVAGSPQVNGCGGL